VTNKYIINTTYVFTIQLVSLIVLPVLFFLFLKERLPLEIKILSFVIYYILAAFLVYYLLTRYLKTISNRVYKILDDSAPDEVKNVKIKDFKHFEEEIGSWAQTQSSEINKLKDMEQYRKEFLGNVSHELKTPIFIVQSYIETLIDGSLFDDKVNLKHLGKALKNILRLSQIVRDLELISKLERSTLVIEKKKFDINSLIKEVTDSLDINARAENIKFVIKIPEQKICRVFADEEKIEQVMTNLLINAIKYSKEKGKIEINCTDQKNKCLIEVKDDGIGIKQENLDRIFERFYRIDKDRSRKKGGTGLGLSIVKHILEAHDEIIQVESEYGKGTKFAFTLEKALK
jgi:two-component system phosphate regulon sensor histidine kinase PhoR